MKLNEFIGIYDKPGSVVLLEGKRKVLAEDAEKLYVLGKILAENTENMLFRSGNAGGADEYFCNGVADVDSGRLEVIIPYTGHRKKLNKATITHSLDDIDLSGEKLLCGMALKNKNSKKQIERYISGIRDKNTVKAAYLLRDTAKVSGAKNILPATAGIFYDDLQAPMQGGTGHTMKICEELSIPVLKQSIWFGWI